MSRRNYRNSLDYIESGFSACWRNAQDLVQAAKVLLDSSLHPLALSTSVLALEELGKLLCIDGLLFARRGDSGKAEAFAKSLKSHSMKLSALECFPVLLAQVAVVDPRYLNEPRYRQALLISTSNLKESGNRLLALLGDGSFGGLDQWKQLGFYAQQRGDSFVAPSEAVERQVSEAVFDLAWRASSTLDFLLKEGNLDRYIASARALRSKLTEEDHRAIEACAEEVVAVLFGDDGESDKKKSH